MKLLLTLLALTSVARSKSYASWCKDKGWSYCTNTKKCGHGLGDCDSNLQCKTGLTCVSSKAGLALSRYPTDCCKCPSTTGNGGWHSCSVNCQCGHNQGDCDSNSQCKTGTECRSSVAGQALGGSAKDYCCNKLGGWHACNTGNCKCHHGQGDCDSDAQCTTGHCRSSNPAQGLSGSAKDYCCKKSGDWSACDDKNCKCHNGQGDCDSNKQCAAGLVCLSGKAGQKLTGSGKDVCTKIVNKGWSGCSSTKKCGQGEGDCDNDSQCKPGHICVSTKDGEKLWGSAVDVCVKKLLVTDEEDTEAADMEAEPVDEAVSENLEAEPTEDDQAVEATEDATDAAEQAEAAEIEGDAVAQEDEAVDEAVDEE